jgi:hypothetical protein
MTLVLSWDFRKPCGWSPLAGGGGVVRAHGDAAAKGLRKSQGSSLPCRRGRFLRILRHLPPRPRQILQVGWRCPLTWCTALSSSSWPLTLLDLEGHLSRRLGLRARVLEQPETHAPLAARPGMAHESLTSARKAVERDVVVQGVRHGVGQECVLQRMCLLA